MPARTLQINGAELTVLDEGAGDPVILINGLLGDYRSWRRQTEALCGNYRVLALSQRYYWPNHWPDDGDGFGVATFAADLAEFISRLDLPKAHVVGHSFGGGVAALFASQHPDRVRSLVLAEPGLATIAMDDPEMPQLIAELGENRKQVFEQWQQGDKMKAVETLLVGVFGRQGFERIDTENLAVINANADIISGASRPRPTPPPPFTPLMARRLTMPVLLIQGSDTKRLFSLTCEKLAGYLPDVRRVVMPGVSHALCLEAPGAFNAAMLEFLAKH